jgi:hypothetical protein
VAEPLAAVASVVVVQDSSAVRSAEPLEASAPLAVAWSVVLALPGVWQVVLVLVPAAWAAQALPRVQPDVSEARLVVA